MPSDLVAQLAQEIRRVDGDHTLGAAALAEALAPFVESALGAGAEPVAFRRHYPEGGCSGWYDCKVEGGLLDALRSNWQNIEFAYPPQPATPASGEVVVRHNDDGTLDEVVGVGEFHLEQMDSNKWWMQLGPHMVTLTARGKISAWFGENEAQLPAPPASTETDKQTATGEQP